MTVATASTETISNSARLSYEFCEACGAAQLKVASWCIRCGSAGLVTRDSSGHGRIHSYTTVYRAPTAMLAEQVPYIIALLDMAEGFRLMVNIQQNSTEVSIGADVDIAWKFGADGTLQPVGRLTLSGAKNAEL